MVKGQRRDSRGTVSNPESAGIVTPIGLRRQQRVLAETERFVSLAEQIFGRQLDRVPVLFDLAGTCAGMFRVAGRERWIRYNPWIFAKYFRENLEGTVPHEVAHYVVHEVFGRRGIKPHGGEWRELMGRFGADPDVTFRLDLSGIPQRRQHTHPYRCACRSHQISSTRHNRVVRDGVRYHCRYCDGVLTFDG